MAEKQMDLPWIKSEAFRRFQAHAVTVTQTDFGEGPVFLFRFTSSMLDIDKETFLAEVDEDAGTGTQKGPAKYHYELIKILEAVATLSPKVVGGLVPVLLQLFAAYPPDRQTEIRAAIAKIPAA